MAHVMFGGLTHEPGIRLAERLNRVAPQRLEKVFFADSGMVSVERRSRMCLQFQRAGREGRSPAAADREGRLPRRYVGRWRCAIPWAGCHSCSPGCCPSTSSPSGLRTASTRRWRKTWAARLSGLVAEHAHELAAVIVEPVVQGAGGMRFHSPECVALLRALCDEHGLLLVLDEIATGFGRTGRMFALRARWRHPRRHVRRQGADRRLHDAGRDALHRGGRGDDLARRGRGLMHGPTFMANPLACSVALASLELLDGGGWRAGVGRDRGGTAHGPRAGTRGRGR